ncbi:MAG TPA: hypothetical protein PKB06_04365, partial [Actinotalea sp.]|nr:hypothetical protein [Actinotalea sp.]
MCAADHAAKSLGLLHLEQPDPGVLVWTTAAGQRFRVVPGRHGAITPLPSTPRRRLGAGAPDPPFSMAPPEEEAM